jgi:hypothetical protein
MLRVSSASPYWHGAVIGDHDRYRFYTPPIKKVFYLNAITYATCQLSHPRL